MFGGTALANASWSGCTDGLSLRINHRNDGATSVREADRGVFGVSTLGGLQRKSATTGPYHEAREFDIALLAGGSGTTNSVDGRRLNVIIFEHEKPPVGNLRWRSMIRLTAPVR